MVGFFRKHLHSRLYKVLAWGIFLVMALAMVIPGFIKQSSAPDWALKVNGEKVGIKEFAQRQETYQQQLHYLQEDFAQRGLPFDPRLLGINIHQLTMNSFVEHHVLLSLGQKLHIHLDESFIKERLAHPYFLRQELSNFISPYVAASLPDVSARTLQQVLREKGYSFADFEHFVEENLKRQMVKDIIVNATYVPRFEARSHFIQNYAAKDYSVLDISLTDVLEKVKEKHVSDEELKTFFEAQNKTTKGYAIPEKRSGTVWEFSPEKYGIVVSDDKIRSYYEKNKQKYISSPTKVKLRKILFKVSSSVPAQVAQARAEVLRNELITSPDMFAHKAKELSEDEATAKHGGLVDYFARGEKDSVLEREAFKLKKNDDISPVFVSREGVEIIQRIDRKPVTYKSFDAVKAEIQQALVRQEFKRQFAKDMERLDRENLRPGLSERNEFDLFMKEKRPKESALHEVTSDISGAASQLFKVKEINNLAYSRDDDKAILVKLTEIKKSYVPSLDSVKQAVLKDYYKQKAHKELVRIVADAKTKAATVPLAQLAKEYDGSVSTIKAIRNEDTDRVNKLVKDGLPIVQMLQMEKVGTVITHASLQDGYVARLDAIESFDEQTFAHKQREIVQDLYRRDASLVAAGFIAYLGRNATLVVNQKAFKTYQDTAER